MALIKRLKSIFYLVFLFLIREAYVLLRNLLGLFFHPYLTLRRIRQENDWLALVFLYLVIASPLLLAAAFSFVYFVFKLLFSLNFSRIGSLVILLDLFLLLIFLLAGGWLTYWLREVLIAEKKNES